MSQSSPPKQGGLSAVECAHRAQAPAPSLRRRMAAFTYEGVVLFGVTMAVGTIYAVSTHQTHGLHGRNGLQAILFLSLALYFMWFWTHGGQTLAMRSWQIRLVSKQGMPITLKQALIRFLLSWTWFAPSLFAAWLAGWHQTKPQLFGALIAWVVVYALTSLFLPNKQFWHDLVSGTRLIDNRT